jgi:hypothetical protein
MVLKFFSGIRYANYLILFFLAACSGVRESQETISVIWKDNKAVAINIPRSYLDNVAEDSVKNILTVHLKLGTQTPSMLGELTFLENEVRFQPLIPLSRLSTYEIRLKNNPIGDVTIPGVDKSEAPVLVSTFPTQDTLPQNLLKFYFQFSKPMREGHSLQHIYLLRDEGDTARNVFLQLQPELWNQEGTMLTLWLDPGRIKRDLQPNKTMGEPLQKNARYKLVVGNTWADIHGAFLKEDYTRTFYVIEKDSVSPDPDRWIIHIPHHGTREQLQINFFENLYYMLVNEAIGINDSEGKSIKGTTKTDYEESFFTFTPDEPWEQGNHTISVESLLEDLAGNNINRLFDQNIKAQSPNKKQLPVHVKRFIIN